MEWLHPLEHGLAAIIQLAVFIFEAIAVFCALAGLFHTVRLGISILIRHASETPLVQLRLQLGVWLILALEFQLGADILSTTVSPS